MRKLQTQDVFKALKVVNALGLKGDMKIIIEENMQGKASETSKYDIGFDIIFKIMERAAGTETEKAVYDFLAGPLEKTSSEVASMDLVELVKDLKTCADVGEWRSFFGSVSGLTAKRKSKN